MKTTNNFFPACDSNLTPKRSLNLRSPSHDMRHLHIKSSSFKNLNRSVTQDAIQPTYSNYLFPASVMNTLNKKAR